jgi:kelch-like protein 10
MNIPRAGLSACVITDLPNTYDYIYKQRDRLLEEKRQRLLALETQRNQQNEQQVNQALIDNEALNDN